MSLKLKNILFEGEKSFVYKEKNCYTVFLKRFGYSESDCSFKLDDDGLSLAIARHEYIEKHFKGKL